MYVKVIGFRKRALLFFPRIHQILTEISIRITEKRMKAPRMIEGMNKGIQMSVRVLEKPLAKESQMYSFNRSTGMSNNES